MFATKSSEIGSPPLKNTTISSFIAFLCDNIFHFQGKLSNFFFQEALEVQFTRISRETGEIEWEIQEFIARTQYWSAEEDFKAVLCDNIWTIYWRKAKKNFQEALELQFARISRETGEIEWEIQEFIAPTQYWAAEEDFKAILCDNIWTF